MYTCFVFADEVAQVHHPLSPPVRTTPPPPRPPMPDKHIQAKAKTKAKAQGVSNGQQAVTSRVQTPPEPAGSEQQGPPQEQPEELARGQGQVPQPTGSEQRGPVGEPPNQGPREEQSEQAGSEQEAPARAAPPPNQGLRRQEEPARAQHQAPPRDQARAEDQGPREQQQLARVPQAPHQYAEQEEPIHGQSQGNGWLRMRVRRHVCMNCDWLTLSVHCRQRDTTAGL